MLALLTRGLLFAPLLASHVALAQEGTPPDKAPEPAQLTVFVADEDGEPLFKAWVTVGPTEAEQKEVPGAGVFGKVLGGQTDPDGFVSIEVPPGDPRTISVSTRDHAAEQYELTIEALAPGEERELEVSLRTKDDGLFLGRAVDERSGEPISGAAVVLTVVSGWTTSGGTPARVPEEPEIVTAEDGSFQVPVASWRKSRIDIYADGYALRCAEVGGATDARGLEERLEIRLAAERVLALEIAGNTAGVTIHAEHQISPQLDKVGPATFDMSARTFEFYPALRAAKEGGAIRIGRLPTEGAAKLVFKRGRSVIHEMRGVSLTGPPGDLQVRVDLRVDGVVSGRVTREDGTPVAGRMIWIGRSLGGSSSMFQSYEKPVQQASTDEEGRFRFTGLVRGPYLVAYPARRGRSSDPSAWICRGEQVDLSLDPEAADIQLVEFPGLTIRGVLQDPSGQPITGHVSASQVSDGSSWNARTQVLGDDGSFTLGPLLPGTYRVYSMGFGAKGHGNSLVVEADAGATDVVVKLRPGGTVRGRVVARGKALPSGTELRITDMETNTASVRYLEQADTFEFDSIAAGEHRLVALTRDGRMSQPMMVQVVAGEAVEEIELEVAPAGVILVTGTGSPDRLSYRVHLEGKRFWGDGFPTSGPARIQLPPGRYEVTVFNRRTKAEASFEVDVKGGETIERSVVIRE